VLLVFDGKRTDLLAGRANGSANIYLLLYCLMRCMEELLFSSIISPPMRPIRWATHLD